MLELHFPPPDRTDSQHLDAVRGIIAEILDIQRAQGNRAGNQLIFDKIGVDARMVRDESYWAEALDYHLGLLYAHVGDSERAAFHLDRSGTHPSDGSDQVFSDHQRDSLGLRGRQELAMARGIPSLVIASMPRSASASLTQTLASTLDAPIMRASCGHFPNFHVVPSWLNSFSRGGGVLHDHFGANSHNLATLRNGGVRRVFVRARDPRSAAASAVSLSHRKYGTPNNLDYDGQVSRLCEQAFIPWLAAWIAAASESESGLKIHWLTKPSAAIPEMAQDVFFTLAAEYPALEQYLHSSLPEIRANFVTGEEDAWRSKIGPATQEQLWSAIPDTAKILLALRQ